MGASEQAKRSVTNVYVDGFNLYYGALKGTPHKWLDLAAVMDRLLPRNDVQTIHYCTALIKARGNDPQGPARQQAYLDALGATPRVQIHLGHFLESTVRMRPAHPVPGAPTTVSVIKTEEKGSDVNLATWLLSDAYENVCETAVLVTNDSDLAFPMSVTSQRLAVTVGLINPHPRKASHALLATRPAFVKQIRAGVLAASQLPTTVRVGSRELTRPRGW